MQTAHKPALGAIRKYSEQRSYAGGGLLDKIKSAVGIAPDSPELAAAKAQAAANRAAAKSQPVPASAPATASASAPETIFQRTQRRREAEAGLKDGGVIEGPAGAIRKMAQKKSVEGAKLRGPGTATSDSIPATVVDTGEPIKVANGERIVSKKQDAFLLAQAKADGFDTVDEWLEDGTGHPVGPTLNYDSTKKMADGGVLDASQLPQDTYTPQAPAPAAAPAFSDTQIQAHKDAAKGIPDTFQKMAVPSLGVIPGFKAGGAIRKMATGGLVDEKTRRLLAQIPTGGTGAGPTAQPDPSQSASGSELGRNVTNTLSALPGAAPIAAGALRLAAAVPALNTAASGVASVAGRAATLAKPALPFAPPAALFAASGGQATEQAPATIASTPAPVAAPAPAPQRPANIAAAPTEASGALPKPANQVTRVGNSYSGAPGIAGDISLVDGNGAPIRSGGAISPQNNQAAENLARRYGQTEGFGTATSGGGTVSTVPGMSQDKINATLTNPDGSRWTAQDNAIMQANIRDGVDPYSGTSRAKKQITMHEYLANQGEATVRRGQDINAAASGAVRKLAESKFNQESQLHNVDLQTKTNILNAQNAFIAAKTPEEKAAAEETFRALQGRYEKAAPELFDRIQTGVDPATGAPIFSVFNKRTGEVGAQATAKPVQNFETGKVYTDAKGNKAKWDGKAFVPA